MNWTEIKDKIYYWDGSWRDIYVLQANRADWKIWVDYVNQNYRIKWFNPKTDSNEDQIDFTIIEDFWSGNHDLFPTAYVFVDEIQINAHFFSETEIENDINPTEFNSIEDHNKLLKYLSDLSLLLDKEIILTPENETETVLLSVDKGNVTLIYHPTEVNYNKQKTNESPSARFTYFQKILNIALDFKGKAVIFVVKILTKWRKN